MTMNTRAHIPKPVAAERLFLHLLGILESFPGFKPSWEEPEGTPFRTTPGPLRLGRATYSHERKGDPLFKYDGTPWCHATTGEQFTADESEFRSTLGQGLPAILEVTYGSDGPLSWPHEPGEECDCSDHGNTADPLHEHLVAVSFDTSYGWNREGRNAGGPGCADLHAFLLRETGVWLASEGVEDWSWHHEERGTWHGPTELHLRGDAVLAALCWSAPIKEDEIGE